MSNYPELSPELQLIADIYKDAPPLPPELQAISDEREKVYGDPYLSHNAIAQAWHGYLERLFDRRLPNIPAYAVAHMMVLMKVLRGATAYKQDNFDDLHVYANFAQRFQIKDEEDAKCPSCLENSPIPIAPVGSCDTTTAPTGELIIMASSKAEPPSNQP